MKNNTDEGGEMMDESKIIYKLGLIQTPELKYEGQPEEYAVCEDNDSATGIMIWGKFGDKWIPNPSCRALVKHMLSAHFGIWQNDALF